MLPQFYSVLPQSRLFLWLLFDVFRFVRLRWSVCFLWKHQGWLNVSLPSRCACLLAVQVDVLMWFNYACPQLIYYINMVVLCLWVVKTRNDNRPVSLEMNFKPDHGFFFIRSCRKKPFTNDALSSAVSDNCSL